MCHTWVHTCSQGPLQQVETCLAHRTQKALQLAVTPGVQRKKASKVNAVLSLTAYFKKQIIIIIMMMLFFVCVCVLNSAHQAWQHVPLPTDMLIVPDLLSTFEVLCASIYSSLLSSAVIKCCNQEQLRELRVGLVSRSQSIKRSQGSSLKQTPQRSAVCWVILCCSTCF